MSTGSPKTLSAFFVLTLAWMIGVVAWAVPAGAKEPAKGPVVVLIFDEFSTGSILDRKGNIHKTRFPNLHRLGRTSTWYRNHTTVADFTTRAVPAILSGNSYPHIYADYRQHRNTIYSFLGAAGYRFRNLEIFSQLCPPTICMPTGPAFLNPRDKEPPNDFGLRILTSGAGEAKRRDAWIGNLSKLKANEAAVGHILLPHGPYRFLPNGQSYRDTLGHNYRGPDGRVIKGNPWLIDSFDQRQLFHIGFTDVILGRIISSLRKSGLWNRATLVVTGDHGTSTKPGSLPRRVAGDNVHEIGVTPLLIKYPDQTRGEVSRSMTQSVDILPTIADTLGLESSLYATDGISAGNVPLDREISVGDEAGSLFKTSRGPTEEWLRKRGRLLSDRLGNRGLGALGPAAALIGTRAPRSARPKKPGLSISGLRSLRAMKGGPRRPALVQGFVSRGSASRSLRAGARLALELRGRFVSSASIYPFAGRKAFAFLIHPKYLGRKGLSKPKIFLISSSGKKTRVF